MKKLLFPLLGMTILASCYKENLFDKTMNEQNLADARAVTSKIAICHNAGNNNWHMINISPNALPAHLAHGDILPDMDGDGYTRINPCGEGSQDDCDDNNAAVHPGAVETCGNNTDDNCNGQADENCYPYVTICGRDWMLKNLDVDKYRDGCIIPEAATDADWLAYGMAGIGAWCYCETILPTE